MLSDIVSDEDVAEEMQNDPELGSGCISGALTEEGFVAAIRECAFGFQRDDRTKPQILRRRELMLMAIKRVLFICIHNSPQSDGGSVS